MHGKRVSVRFGGAVAALLMGASLALGQDYNEAPELKARVEAGELPPVAERLPDNPMVLEPAESVGTYGGDFRTGLVGAGGSAHMSRFHAYEPLVRYNADWSGVVPNVAESFTSNEEATEFTFTLREGMKWSDGEPFTTDDIMFWYEDIYLNAEIENGGQNWLQPGGEKARFEKIDDTTFKVTFAVPHGLFPAQIAWGNQDQITRAPKHYLQEFHIKYNPDADKLADEMGFAGWAQLFEQKAGIALIDNYFRNPDMPVLTAWEMDVPMGESTSKVVTVRNPYYFKVDTEGNQLPYFDRLTYDLVTDEEVFLLKVMQGEIDMVDQYVARPNNKAVLFDNQEAGGYEFYRLLPTQPNEMVIQLNLTHPHPVKRELFQNRDFRIALSHAIDRQALIDAVFVGEGEPSQPCILREDANYYERLCKQYTEFDPDKANAILDEIVPDKNADGIRLDTQGRPITIVFELDQARAPFLDMFQLITPMLSDVGIDAQIRPMDRSLWEVRVRNGDEFDATAHRFGGGAGLAAVIDARYFVPDNQNSFYAKGWQAWFADADAPNAVEPPQAAKDLVALYGELQATADPAKQKELFAKILEINADEFYIIGITQPAETYGVVRTDVRNAPAVMPNSFGYPNPAPTNPETYWRG